MLATSPIQTPELLAKMAGVFAPICTPFADNEEVDYEGLVFNLARYSESGLLGYPGAPVPMARTAASQKKRSCRVLSTIVRHKGRGQVVMAAATYEFAAAIRSAS